MPTLIAGAYKFRKLHSKMINGLCELVVGKECRPFLEVVEAARLIDDPPSTFRVKFKTTTSYASGIMMSYTLRYASHSSETFYELRPIPHVIIHAIDGHAIEVDLRDISNIKVLSRRDMSTGA